MTLARINHIPSERMGLIWILLNVEDGIVLEYGPAGTTHFSMNFFSKLVPELRGRLFTTDMKEKDLVFGDTSQLLRAIKELDGLYNPKAIFVVNSTISSVIGTDVDGICSELQSDVRAKLIPVSSISMSNDYTNGVEKAYKILIDNLVENKIGISPKTYNILGASAYDYRVRSDVWEYNSLMSEAFAYKMSSCLALDISCATISKIGKAEVNIVCSKEALPIARHLEMLFGTPFVYKVPYGYKGTIEFLETVSDVIGVKVAASFKSRLEKKLDKSRMSLMNPFRLTMGRCEPHVYIEGNADNVEGLSVFFKSMGFKIAGARYAYCKKDWTVMEPAEFLEDDSKYVQQITSLKHCLVLGNKFTKQYCDDSNIKICISNPADDLECIANHLPFIGEKGADYLQEYINMYIKSL